MDEESGCGEEKEAEQKCETKDKPKKVTRKRKSRKKQPAGLRRQIRTKFDTVEDLNPVARLAQTDEIERIRRLELQQSLTVSEKGVFEPVPFHGDDRKPDPLARSSSSSSHEYLDNVVQSDPDVSSDSTEDEGPNESPEAEPPHVLLPPPAPTPPLLPPPLPRSPPLLLPASSVASVEKGIEAVQRKYDLLGRREDGRVLVNVGHPPKEPDIFLAPQIGRIVQQHQVSLGTQYMYRGEGDASV